MMRETAEQPTTGEQAGAGGRPGGREADARPALTARGRRTRQALIAAAIEVFSEEGYFSSRLSAITDRVGCSTGTLYTYFANRQEILAAIIEDSYAPVVAAEREDRAPISAETAAAEPEALVAQIREATAVYVGRYREHARVFALMEQVSAVDPAIREIRLERARVFYRRNARSIAQMQQAGFVRRDLDPLLTAKALSAMVSRTCRSVFIDEPDERYHSEDGIAELADTLARMWAGALELRGRE